MQFIFLNKIHNKFTKNVGTTRKINNYLVYYYTTFI